MQKQVGEGGEPQPQLIGGHEVGAGILIISLSYGIGGPIVTISMLSLAVNLMLTGFFIYLIKQLTKPLPIYSQMGLNAD